jgi:hypothetical protein
MQPFAKQHQPGDEQHYPNNGKYFAVHVYFDSSGKHAKITNCVLNYYE